MDVGEIRDVSNKGSISYPSVKDQKESIGFATVPNSAYRHVDGEKLAVGEEATTPVSVNPTKAIFTEKIEKSVVEFDNDPDSVISDEVAKDIEKGLADIKAGRTYTTDQVKEMLGL